MLFLRIIYVLHLVVTVLEAGKLLEKCSNDSECPAQSKCLERGCDGLMCICTDNSMPSEDETRCVPIAEIGEKCSKTRRCRGQNSRCDVTGICVCDPDHMRVHLDQSNITYCKLKHILETEPLLVGQHCTGVNSFCSDVLGKTECLDGRCRCKQGYRTSTKDEINLFPYQLLQCVPLVFGINNSIPDKFCPFKPAASSASVSTRSSDLLKPTSTSVVDISSHTSSTTAILSTLLENSVTTLQTSSAVHSSEKWLSSSVLSSSHGIVSSYTSPSAVTVSTDIVSSYTSPSAVTDSTFYNSRMKSSIPSLKVSRTSSVGNMEIVLSSLDYLSTGVNSLMEISASSYPSFRISKSKTSVTDTESAFSNVVQTKLHTSSSETLKSSSSEHILPESIHVSSTVVLSNQLSVDIHTSDKLKTSIQPSSPTISNVLSSVDPIREHTSYLDIKPSSTDMLPFPSSLPVTSEASTTNSEIRLASTGSQGLVTWPSSVQVVTPSATKTVTTPQGRTHSTSGSLPTVSPPFSVPTTTRSTQRVMDGEECSSSSLCLNGGVCEKDRCGTDRCRRQIGYVFDISVYRKLQKIGEPCDVDTNCMGPFTKCKAGLCRCKDDYVMHSNGVWCTHVTSWFIHFPLMEDTCSSFFYECFHSAEQTCVKGKCKCKPGLRKAEEADFLVPSDNYFQCRNMSLKVGEREPRNCRDGVETLPLDPNYNAAIDRIRKMQGIIFGTIAGVVVVICCIIGAVCYYRYRNRTMVKDMRSDNGSEISFDRQSIGKYSFKIPRPFMPIIKDWETAQMSYANSAFTSDDTEIAKGDQTLRSSRSIPFPDQSDPEGYNRPNERNLSISTTSTIDADLTSLTDNFETKNIENSPPSVTKSYKTDQTDLKFGEG